MLTCIVRWSFYGRVTACPHLLTVNNQMSVLFAAVFEWVGTYLNGLVTI